MSWDEMLNYRMDMFDVFMEDWDKRLFIPLREIFASGLFDNMDDINVFFYSFDEEYYSTDNALLREFGKDYIDYLDEMGLNRLHFD